MTPLEAIDLATTALRHARAAEQILEADQEPLSTVACTGALILGRAAYIAHQAMAAKPRGKREAKRVLPTYRMLAHQILEEALNEVELLMTKTEGRA